MSELKYEQAASLESFGSSSSNGIRIMLAGDGLTDEDRRICGAEIESLREKILAARTERMRANQNRLADSPTDRPLPEPDHFENALNDLEFDELKPGEFYERFEDMSPTGKLSLMIQDDGDVIVTIWPDSKVEDSLQHVYVEFCTYSGGGQSPRVRKALMVLAEAIRRDNEERTQNRG